MEFGLYSTENGYAIEKNSYRQYHKKLDETGLSWRVRPGTINPDRNGRRCPVTFVSLNSLEDLMLLKEALGYELIVCQQSSEFPELEIYDDYRE